MKILVTGGAGFIGSHVCDALIARGDGVVSIDNFNDFYSPQVKERNLIQLRDNPSFRQYHADILDVPRLKEIFTQEKPEKMIHLAARAGVRPSLSNPLLYEEVNVKGTINLLDLARDFKLENFVFASSSSVYGNRKSGPFSETDNVDAPVSPYAATKKAGELMCYTYHHLYGLNTSCLRFFTVYGPRGRPDMALLKFTDQISRGEEIEIYGDGTSQRDYTYVSDIVEGILSALDNNYGYEIFNLGGSSPVELNYFVSLIEQNLGKKAQLRYAAKKAGDVEITFADTAKSERMLGYKPKISIEEGVRRFVEWYKSEQT